MKRDAGVRAVFLLSKSYAFSFFQKIPICISGDCKPVGDNILCCDGLKGGFFSESLIHFLDLQISKKIFQKTIQSLKFKFQAQDNCFGIFFFGDLEI